MKLKKINVDRWNANCPVGTPVIVTRDNGAELETVTRSEAWDLCGTAVVKVEGIAGGYACDRVRKANP